ncbi:Imm1 family immunity protein [Kitasatospora phosalacinea]|uniref:Imm1 family immunity protein n=1 Tax=Kitasatospora phosalacinea TaxID=2065 RepID=UPI0035E33D19
MDLSNQLEVRYHTFGRQNPFLASIPKEVDQFIDALLERSDSHDAAHVLSTARPRLDVGFPDHELYVGVDRDASAGMLILSLPETGTLVSAGFPGLNVNRFHHVAGHPIEFPDGSGVPILFARQAVKEFLLLRGGIPDCIEWRPYGNPEAPVDDEDIWS